MLGFILSKMNLLIMVTAIFAIVAYLALFIGRSLEVREAQAVLDKLVEETYGIVSSTGQCHQTIVAIPRYIHSIGTGELNNQMKFLVHVNKIPAAGGKTTISYSIWPKKSDKALAAQPFGVESSVEVELWEWDNVHGGMPIDGPKDEIIINPNSEIATDSLLLVKEVYLGKTTLFIATCSSELGDWCKKVFLSQDPTKLGLKQKVLDRRGTGAKFNCETPFT